MSSSSYSDASGPFHWARSTLWRAVKRVLRLGYPYRWRLSAALVLTSIGALVSLVVPLGLRELLNAVFEDENARLLNLLAAGLFGLFLLRAVIGFAGRYLLEWTGERVVADLRQRVYQHLHRLSLRFFADHRTGDLTSRLTNDVGTIRSAVTSALSDLLTQTLSLVGSAALMVALNWRLSLMTMIVVPIVSVGAVYFGRKIRTLSRSIQDRLADTTAISEEAISAIRVVKAFGRAEYEVDRYRRSIEDLFETSRTKILVSSVFSSAVGLLFFSSLVAIFWFGGREVLADRLTAGDLVAFIFYAFNIARSVGSMSRLYTTFNSVAGASERLFELLDTRPEISDSPTATALQNAHGTLHFDRVWFAYEEDHPVLRDITIVVDPGETVALVGPSGAGKSTLMSLIPRFYDPTQGRILLDGRDLRELTLESLRGSIAVVSQEVTLFNTTIRENIAYGRLEGTEEEVAAAARAANADEFIRALPEGYETRVGERGVKLSGGQRQRIAIARAILRDSRILLLDEATSSLDSAAEALVQEALERLMADRTTFIIAHRLSTVQHADRILVLDRGELVEIGTHHELLQRNGLYRGLAEHQLRREAV